MRLLIRIVLQALTIAFLLPHIPGIEYHGGFLVACCLAILFGVMQWLVELLCLALAAYLTISTFGVALLILVPMWILGFWLLPAVALKLAADFMPQHLVMHGWLPAILGSLGLLAVGMVTSGVSKTIVKTKD